MQDNTTPEAILQAALTSAQAENAELKKQLEAEAELRGKADQELLDANTIIDDLNKRLNELASKPAAGQPDVVVLGTDEEARKFVVKVPAFHFNGHKVKAADVKSNSDLLKQLVEAGAGVLEEVQ